MPRVVDRVPKYRMRARGQGIFRNCTCRFVLGAAGVGVFARGHSSIAAAPPATPYFSAFGIGGDYHTGMDLTNWIPKMADIGIPMMRCCHVNQMDYLDAHHMKYGGLLYGLPPGDTIDARGTLPVNDLPAWTDFVTRRVKEVNGRVQYWEVWNEPPNGIGPHQTPADYSKIVVAAYDAARAVDPGCKIGLAAKSVDVNWLEQTIMGGTKDHFDYIVLHPYETLGIAVDHSGDEPVFMNIVRAVRLMLIAQDPAKANVPIIFTELGSDASRGLEHQATALVKAYTMGIAQGVDCIEWFEGIDGDSGPMGLLQANGKPRPSYTAMAQMIRILGLHPIYLGWILQNNKDYGFLFQGTNGTVLITWAPKGDTDTIDFGQIVQIVDPTTGDTSKASTATLATAPIIVLNPPETLISQARANQSKAFPWHGDYTNAKSVSITFGEKNVEQGLHTHSAEAIARDVIAYGGSARAGDVPGGNVFNVDPNFLCYTSTPIEITVVVRRNAANDNAGFKLLYESTSGFKNLGWYTVPDNKAWHTMTWKIDDAQFVNMWGYNFSLNSDGKKYNKYDIQSVTVTKVAG